MLKLTVKPGDSIRIDNAKITVTQSSYNRIQLEIDAPPEIRVNRIKADAPQKKVIVVKGMENLPEV